MNGPPCKDCGDAMCQAFRERILPGRSSYACALRVIDKLRARVAELEAMKTPVDPQQKQEKPN